MPKVATDYSALPVVMTPQDVATKVLGCGRDKVYAMLESGNMPGKRLGGRWMIPRSALLKWLDSEAEEEQETRRKQTRGLQLVR